MRARYWEELNAGDFPVSDAEATVALLPVAAVEQHGPHLPLGTDAMINRAVVAAAMQTVAGPARLLVLPAQQVGDSLEHTAFAGTLSVAGTTLLESWLDLGRAVSRAGVRKLLVFNTHGGNTPLVDLAALRLRADEGMLVARVSSFRLGAPEGLFSTDELAHGLHGGEVETSLMLHLHPTLVREAAVEDFDGLAAQWARQGRLLGVERPAGIGWMAGDLNPAGVCGNAARADPERGRQLLEHQSAALARIVGELAATPLDVLAG